MTVDNEYADCSGIPGTYRIYMLIDCGHAHAWNSRVSSMFGGKFLVPARCKTMTAQQSVMWMNRANISAGSRYCCMSIIYIYCSSCKSFSDTIMYTCSGFISGVLVCRMFYMKTAEIMSATWNSLATRCSTGSTSLSPSTWSLSSWFSPYSNRSLQQCMLGEIHLGFCIVWL